MTERAESGQLSGIRLQTLRALGFADLEHDSHVPFMAHLVGTRRLLIEWGCDAALCDAGLFHSVYGTEYFESDSPVTRSEITNVIGSLAERIAWLWCTIVRDSIDVEAETAINRNTGEEIHLASGELADLATLWAADTVEQIQRMTTEERAFARNLVRVLHLADPAARDACTPIMALIPQE